MIFPGLLTQFCVRDKCLASVRILLAAWCISVSERFRGGGKKKPAQLEHFPRMPVSSQDRQGLDRTDVSTQKQMWRCYFPREEMWWGLLLTSSPHMTASLDQQLENLEKKHSLQSKWWQEIASPGGLH